MHKGYYESILQVRPRSSEAEKAIEDSLKGAGNVRLAKRKVLKEGVDYYLSSWRFALALGNALVKRFGGQLNVSRKLFGISRKKGSTVFRSTVLFRAPAFYRGDVVACEDKIALITSVGKVVIGKNLVGGKRERIDEGKKWEKLKLYTTTVSKIFPELEVINPEDYQSVSVKNPEKKDVDERVKVALYKGVVYLV